MENVYWKDEIYSYVVDLVQLARASEINLYWIDQKTNVIFEKQTDIAKYESCEIPLDDQRYLVAIAATRKQIIYVESVQTLWKTNPEIFFPYKANNIICIPILNFDMNAILVVELYKIKEVKFSKTNLSYVQEFAKWFAIWMSLRLKYSEEAQVSNFRNILNLYLLEYVSGTYAFKQFLTNFLGYCKRYIKADKFFFYQYDADTGFSDFYEEVDGEIMMTANRITFHKADTFCFHVISSGKPFLVQLEDGCESLNKEIRSDPENPIRYMLFQPIFYGLRFLGVLAFGNIEGESGRNCAFTEEDQTSVGRMVSLLADTLVYVQIEHERKKQTAHTEILKETFTNLLRARMRPEYMISGNVHVPKQLHRLKWELTEAFEPHQMSYICKMFHSTYRFDWDRLRTFLLCTQIAHNDYPYHNMKTTFHICRTVYCITDMVATKLKQHEKAALMMAAVIYYAGHNQLDNHFMLKTKHPLTQIYKTYFKENHRMWMLDLLLNQTKLLPNDKESEHIVSLAKLLLLKSKKLEANIFRQKINKMLDTETFCINNETHRMYILLLILRIGIHGRHMQPFNVAKILRDNYYEEMKQLGEKEFSEDLNVNERKTKEAQFKVSTFEIEYITKSVLPTLNLLIRIFPETSTLLAIPSDVLKAHEILVSAGNKRLWDPNAFGKKDRTYWVLKK